MNKQERLCDGEEVLSNWKGNEKGRPFAFGAFHPQPAAKQVDDLRGDI
jgi:hypothetical protein